MLWGCTLRYAENTATVTEFSSASRRILSSEVAGVAGVAGGLKIRQIVWLPERQRWVVTSVDLGRRG